MEERLLLSIITQGFDNLGSSLSGAVTNIAALGLALGPVGIALGIALEGFKLLTGAIGAMKDLAVDGFNAVKDFIVGSTQVAIDFEDAFAAVAKTVSGVAENTGELTVEGEELREALENLAEEIPVTFEGLTQIAEAAGQMGVGIEGSNESIDTFTDFVRIMAQVTASTNLEIEDATREMARFTNVMGTAPDEVEKVASALVDLGNNTATTEKDILNFSQRIAGIGNVVGLTEAEVLALGATFTETGGRVEASGTAVQKTLIAMDTSLATFSEGVADNTTHIANETRELRELDAKLLQAQIRMSGFTDETNAGTVALQQLKIEDLQADVDATTASIERLGNSNGKTFVGGSEQANEFLRVINLGREAAGEMALSGEELKDSFGEGGAGDALQFFITGLGEVEASGGNAAAILKDLELGDQRLARSFLAVASSSALLTDNINRSNTAFEKGTALQIEADKRFSTTAQRIEVLKNRFTDFRSEVGDLFLPLVEQVIDRLFGLGDSVEAVPLQVFAAIAEAIGELLPHAFELFDDAVQIILEVLPLVVDGIGNLIIFAQDAAVWIGDILPLAFAALQEIWAALTDDDGPITVMVLLWENRLRPALEELQEHFGERGPESMNAWAEIWNQLIMPSIQFGIDLLSVTIIILGLLVEIFLKTLPIALEVFLAAWNAMNVIITAGNIFIAETLMPTLDRISEWFAETIPPAIETATEWWNLFQEAMIILGEFTQDHLIPLLLELANLFEVILAKALELLLAIWETQLQPALETTWAFIQDNLNPILIALGDWVGTVTEKTNTLEQDITNKLNPALEFARQAVEALRGALSSIGSFLDSVAARVRSLADAISNLSIPAPFQTESPPPFAVGLSIIREEVLALTNALPQLTKSLFDLDSPRRDPGISKSESFSDNRKFILNAQSMMSPGELALEFRTMELATR